MTREHTAADAAKHRARRVPRLAAAASSVVMSLGALGAMAPPASAATVSYFLDSGTPSRP